MRHAFKLVTLALAFGAGLALFGTTSEARTLDVSLEQSFVGEVASCLDCSACVVEGVPGHKALDGDKTSVHDRGGGSHTVCMLTGTCLSQHPIAYPHCDGDESEFAAMRTDLEAVRQAIVSGRLARAIEIAEQQPDDRVQYVADRNAIQAIGCNGTLIAHLPLD